MKLLKLTFPVFALLLIISACKKGDMGTPGSNGTNGNANVHSKTFTITNWNNVGTFWDQNIADSAITKAIEDSGSIIVYINSDPWWNALPYANNNAEWRYEYLANTVKIIYLNADGTLPANPGTKTFKVTTIAAQ